MSDTDDAQEKWQSRDFEVAEGTIGRFLALLSAFLDHPLTMTLFTTFNPNESRTRTAITEMRPRSTLISLALAGLALVPAALARDIPSTVRSPLANQGVCSGFYREDFNGGALPHADQWNGDPNSASWVDEFGSGSFIANGYLEMDLRRPPGAARGQEAAVTWTRCVS